MAYSFAGLINAPTDFGRQERAMARKKKCNIPADKQALYDKLLATHPKIERKGAANPYTSLNGHMFTYLISESVGDFGVAVAGKRERRFSN